MTGTQRQKLQAIFGALLLVTVGPVSGLSAGGGALLGQEGYAGNQSLGAGNQPTGSISAGNQTAGGGISHITWNESTEPNASQVGELGPRTNASQPFTVVGDQPTDPNNDSLYEDINGDGQINIVDSDALQRNLNSTAVGANWSAYDFTQDNRTDIGDVLWLISVTRGVAVNDSDGDGLPNAYERNWTDTDPTVADTDSDGRIDGAEDPDGDGLISHMEYRVGSDPKAADTDGDGFSDGREDDIPGISPAESDTDGDGIPDPQDDLDGDNLSVENESVYNTSRRLPDTDSDGLGDGSEVHKYGTNATDPDTDSDGINDGAEIKAGLDPLVADSDGDGIVDANETVAVTQAHDATNVSLTLRAEGAVANATIDEKPSYFPNSSAHAGPTVRVENRTTFENATIAMPIDESVAADEYENLSVYTWNGSANDTWSRVETTIENGTARATVDHFSYFTVLHTEEWVSATTIEVGNPIDFNASDSFRCRNACNLTSNETVLLGGEPTARKITVEQGNDTYEVVPLSNGQTIEDFYNYGNDEINSRLEVTKSDASRLFFWSGPDGLSLVVIHDKPSDGAGAAATFIMDGLPVDGSWVVQDDPGSSYRDQYGTTPDWTWSASATDGGAFRGGLTNATLTIEPRFNETAELAGLRAGDITDWEILSGRATDPNNESLALDQDITIHVPGDPDENESSVTSGDSGTANVSYQITDDINSLAIVYQTEQTGIDPEATVEVTGANGNSVSESLSIGTVGTVQEGLDLSALETGLANVSLSADGVNMRAQVVRRGSVDADGDGIRDSVEEQTWRLPNGDGSTFNLSATDPDTDNDGLSDSEEIAFKRKIVDGELRVEPAYARSNPVDSDTDGDGLDDGREVNGWAISVLDNHGDASDFVDAVSNNESDTDQYITNRPVSSNPRVTDTDGDSLADGREELLGTHPNAADTDNDGHDDGEELDDETDPTLFDVSAPTVEINEAQYESRANPFAKGPLNYYDVNGAVSDQSAIASSTVIIDGEEFENEINPRFFSRRIDAGILGGVEEGLTVTKIKVRVTDEHGNSRTVLASARSNGIVEAVEQSGGLDELPTGGAFVLGTATGISSGTGQLVGTVDSVVNSPRETYDSLTDLDKYEQVVSNADDIPGLLVDSYQNQQRAANPYYRNDQIADESRYQNFRRGYYSGLIVFEVAAAAAGSSAAARARNIQQVQRAASAARATRAARYYRAARTRFVSAPASRVSSKVTRSVTSRVDFDSPVVQRTMAGTRTVGRSIRTGRYIANTPNRVLRDLNERGQAQLRAYYRGIRGRDGDTGLEAMTDGGQDTLKNTLETRDIPNAGAQAAQLQRRLDTDEFQEVYDADLPDDTRNSLLRAEREGDLSASETARAARSLDGSDNSDVRQAIRDLDDAQQRRAYKLVGQTGDDGVELIDGMNTQNRETFFSLGTRDRFGEFDDFDTWRTAVANAEDVDAAKASRYAARVDRAADRDNIEDVDKILDDTIPSTDDVAGESGEAASAIRYADDGADVTIEPGSSDIDYYDMAITRGEQTEYVEVKTRASGDVTERYISERITVCVYPEDSTDGTA